ncbi:hypothetical protein EV2_022044 [Malus domestica]
MSAQLREHDDESSKLRDGADDDEANRLLQLQSLLLPSSTWDDEEEVAFKAREKILIFDDTVDDESTAVPPFSWKKLGDDGWRRPDVSLASHGLRALGLAIATGPVGRAWPVPRAPKRWSMSTGQQPTVQSTVPRANAPAGAALKASHIHGGSYKYTLVSTKVFNCFDHIIIVYNVFGCQFIPIGR